MLTTLRGKAAVLLAVFAVLVTGACSSAGGTGSPEVMAFINKLKAGGQDARTVHMTMKLTGLGQDLSMSGDATYDTGNPAMKLEMSVASRDVEMIYLDKALYLKGFPNDPPGEWTKADPESAVSKQLIESTTQMDPNATYTSFEEAATGVKELGPQMIDGERMSMYEVTLDPRKAKELQNKQGSDQLPDAIVYTIAVDDKDRLRRVSFDVLGIKAEMTMDKYNEPVDIRAPSGDLPTSRVA